MLCLTDELALPAAQLYSPDNAKYKAVKQVPPKEAVRCEEEEVREDFWREMALKQSPEGGQDRCDRAKQAFWIEEGPARGQRPGGRDLQHTYR